MNKKGYIEMTVGTIVTIVLVMSALVLGLVLTKTIFSDKTLEKEYHFYQVNCTLESPNDTCNDKIEVNNISILGYEINTTDINGGILENYFTNLTNNTWSRGKYLVIYE